MEVQFKFIQVFASKGIQKHFHIKDFLDHFPVSLNGTDEANIKDYLIHLVQIFQQNNLARSDYKILMKGEEVEVDELTSRNISQGFVIFEKIDYQ